MWVYRASCDVLLRFAYNHEHTFATAVSKKMLWADKHRPTHLSRFDYHQGLCKRLSTLVRTTPEIVFVNIMSVRYIAGQRVVFLLSSFFMFCRETLVFHFFLHRVDQDLCRTWFSMALLVLGRRRGWWHYCARCLDPPYSALSWSNCSLWSVR